MISPSPRRPTPQNTTSWVSCNQGYKAEGRKQGRIVPQELVANWTCRNWRGATQSRHHGMQNDGVRTFP